MKTLLLMRHAKSSWKENELPDQERPLNKRGESDAPRMGKLLKKEGFKPDMIIASPAVRTVKTAEAIKDKIGFKGEITLNESLYLGEAEDYLAALTQLPDEVDEVLIIGHNPGLETLLQLLSGKVESLPSAAVAVLKLPVRVWGALNTDIEGKLDELWRPKELKG